MSRRRQAAAADTGSDSFLDVIANIVGILIILIVIAGVRVSQAPLPMHMRSPAEVPADVPEYNEPESPMLAAPEPEPEQELEELEPLRPHASWIAAASELEAEAERIGAELARSLAVAREAETEQSQIQQKLTELQRNLKDWERTHTLQASQVRRTTSVQQAEQSELTALRRELFALRSEEAPVTKVKHRVTPISRVVQGEELHFRLANNRVSVVPLKELSERLLKQAERQKDWLAKYRRHQGSVGPVGGYTMNYVVERQSLSAVQRMHHGPGVFRVAVTGFQLIPDEGLRGESSEQAGKVGSEFHLALASAPPNSALTFWVYPDSFELYRKLQELAHDAGFTVAARPLPFGVPISGSPQGTRSAGQ